MGLLDRIAAAQQPSERRSSIDTWISDYLLPSQFSYGGTSYPLGNLPQTLVGARVQEISATLPGYMAALRTSPPAFGAQMVRALVLSQARFAWRRLRNRTTFGTSALQVLERPWRNATTGQLLARMEWHAGLAGNAFVTRQPGRLRVLRPDWVAIVFGSQQEPEDAATALDGEIIGYAYLNGGFAAAGRNDVHTLLPADVAHWSPLPDPENAELGMSWITPAIRDIQGDRAATDHKLAFFTNGAPQPLTARVLTPCGWTTMGEVAVGDRVIGADGKPKSVVAVYPQGDQDIYRVTFSSGGSTECTADHLWTVASAYDRKRGTTRTMTLAQVMAGGVRYASGPAKWSVPLVDPVEFDSPGPLPVAPYLLGSLLGDGSFRSNGRGSGGVSLAAAADDADEQASLLGALLPAGVSISRRDRGGWVEFYFRGPGAPRTNPLTAAIRELGLFDRLGHEKSIPDVYLRGSVTDRLELLRGLLDTDGSVDGRQPNTVRFDSTSRALADGVADLAGGLGGIASVRPGRPAGPGRRAQWRVTVSRLPEWIIPFCLARKASRYDPRCDGRWRHIRSVELVGRRPAQCIGVDSADHLYVTDDYVLTHNTPNMVIKGIQAPDQDKFDAIVDMLEEAHSGVRNAYKTWYLTAGVDATVVGKDLQQVDFKATQGAGETRISVLSRVPAPLLGISEGLAGSSLNAGNFGMARRMFADTWVYPTLADAAAALAPLVDPPRNPATGQPDAELWFDTQDMPLLREDAKDAAEITQIQAATIAALVKEGFTADSATTAVVGQDMTLLQHTGLVSVQLQPPGTAQLPADSQPALPAGGA